MNVSKNGIVLVVDDDRMSLETCRLLLEPEGYLVHMVTNSEEAISLGQMVKPDLFLLDILMSEIEGYETCRHLKDSIEIIKETAGSIHDVMATLHPPVLDDYGLKAVLQMALEKFSARTDIRTALIGEDITPQTTSGVGDSCFPIAQEALSNVAKHAAAQRVTLLLEHIEDLIRLTTIDDGVGFDVHSLSADHSSGWDLMNMRDRIQAFDGTLRIVSKPGEGARVIVEVFQSG